MVEVMLVPSLWCRRPAKGAGLSLVTVPDHGDDDAGLN